MINLISTYRFQFHKDFRLEDIERIISYLEKLGIGAVYASPVFESVPGSTHGYDGLNPHRINPEIGTEEQLRQISKKLRTGNIGWLQDIVPNHMAYHPANHWLMDVLEKGPQSTYSPFFDITWGGDLNRGRLMVPFLGLPLPQAIEKGDLKIAYADQRLVFDYFGNHYPLQALSYKTILQSDTAPDAIKQFLSQIPKGEDPKTYAGQWDEHRKQLDGLTGNETVQAFVQQRIKEVSNNKKVLQEIADEQFYRLCHWQETDRQINYRRFFIVNGLICLNMQDPHVFDTYHLYIRSLMEEGIFQGLRVDHIDGLYDPPQYLQRLRDLAEEESYIVVEKILEPGEKLPDQWPVQGNTGYDFLSYVNNLLTQKSSEGAFTHYYRQLVKENSSVRQQIQDKKEYILRQHMSGELDNLYHLFFELNLVDKKTFSAIRREEIKETIAAFLIQCPVYRYYGNQMPLQGEEHKAVEFIFNSIRVENPELKRAIDVMENALLKMPQEGNQERNQKALHFYRRCMQFTGPLMAKGVEDTLMYTYNRFAGHNEVGDSPEAFGWTKDEFHQAMIFRQQSWPFSLSATSTHDTKRGEDVRARLNVLTDLPEEWLYLAKAWQNENAALKEDDAPDANDEYLIYQALVGTYPMPGEEEDDFNNRFKGYLQKALREAKVHSNWTSANEVYENATASFAMNLLARDKPFWKSFQPFHKKIADHGIVNSLTQVLLKFTCPGIPDIYQGCELWDFSMVDPDNRRPVNYELREQWLNELGEKENEQLAGKLWKERFNGKIKLWLVHTLLKLRRRQPDIFTTGEYIPVKTEGTFKDHILAFARRQGQNLYLVAVPLHSAAICKEQEKEVSDLDWKDTSLVLPASVSDEWEHILTGTADIHKKQIPVQHLFKAIPLAVLKGQQLANERGAGILLHITSLASPFGIGDMGSEARNFALFLHRTHQKYWQLLPLNPTEGGQGHSPYSSISSRAGNTLLISPELLVKDRLLNQGDLPSLNLPADGKTNYTEALRIKEELFKKAWNNFRQGRGASLKEDFEVFKGKEAAWLDDFALYMALKQLNNGKPWYEWEEKYKMRNEQALHQLKEQQADEMEKIKWLQFLFIRQWKQLKSFCNDRNIKLLGDLPFYVSYDSADVWANKEIFCLDEKGNRSGMAGVPPDAFSDDGQLWGMPVFRWKVLKERKYDWWVDRFRKNKELFDLVRLDHFRAFSAYWEVPAGEQTAKNGTWQQGPGSDFFAVVKEALGELPFVAEDLGDIDEPVYRLRDEFHLPGMKVLQFAFSEDMPQSPHIPHNYTTNFIVYSGTHDNNTVRGWYRQEGSKDHQRLEQYVGRSLSEDEAVALLCRMAYSSVAQTVILPLQDVLGLDEIARMNTPASGQNNWGWRLMPGQIPASAENQLREWVEVYNRR